uniref:Uncharacterized protein n=1 Tax=Physcomitrium patens TaxID=3218 RepID=A0A2K1IFY8_PHYPA|nr:hypothetical protein PHYPA_028781 [Physcomitrium patens]
MNVQLYKQSFHKEYCDYCSHNKCEYFVEWKAYNFLINEENKSCFVNNKKSTINTFLNSYGIELHSEILASIIKNIINTAFFYLKDDKEYDSKAIIEENTLKLFFK